MTDNTLPILRFIASRGQQQSTDHVLPDIASAMGLCPLANQMPWFGERNPSDWIMARPSSQGGCGALLIERLLPAINNYVLQRTHALFHNVSSTPGAYKCIRFNPETISAALDRKLAVENQLPMTFEPQFKLFTPQFLSLVLLDRCILFAKILTMSKETGTGAHASAKRQSSYNT